MPRNDDAYWDLQWHKMEPSYRSSSAIAHMEDAVRGSNRRTFPGKPGDSGGHFKGLIPAGERRT
jgi:hypothetical protein